LLSSTVFDIIHLLTGMRVITSLLFPKTLTIARCEAKTNSWCRREPQTWYYPNI